MSVDVRSGSQLACKVVDLAVAEKRLIRYLAAANLTSPAASETVVAKRDRKSHVGRGICSRQIKKWRLAWEREARILSRLSHVCSLRFDLAKGDVLNHSSA
jgi:hypothetical protein